MKTDSYEVKTTVYRDGEVFPIGETIALPEEAAAPLLASGVIVEISDCAVKSEESDDDASRAGSRSRPRS